MLLSLTPLTNTVRTVCVLIYMTLRQPLLPSMNIAQYSKMVMKALVKVAWRYAI